ncbi:Crp/Fnr family transcriptional regulator [Scytonema hofmannii FACHB-248]|uniref:Crp/Fnr family transcriptional regulator n=1 Tax=Scytonema hofmannii FACHB-248 TaxID=1842502 RepID=A0ABR8GJ40_9CYAN|nr:MULTISPECIES: Crp/Fnr family transcriptional regulator [Nostocales]MBD2603232.1 Crp/Fnr family transcriptional regulator [Scytonema hofmannii FACHB-248]
MSLYSAPPNSVSKNTVQYFSRRSLLPQHTQTLWKIETGVVRTFTYLEDGTSVTLGVWGSGDIVGKALSKVEPYQIECLTKVQVTIFDFQGWDQIADVLLAHIQQAEELMIVRGYKTVDIMLIKLLTWLSKRFGREVEQGRLIDMRLTHEDIAELLGSTRVTITRILRQLEEEGFIHRLSLHRIVLREEEIWHYEI